MPQDNIDPKYFEAARQKLLDAGNEKTTPDPSLVQIDLFEKGQESCKKRSRIGHATEQILKDFLPEFDLEKGVLPDKDGPAHILLSPQELEALRKQLATVKYYDDPKGDYFQKFNIAGMHITGMNESVEVDEDGRRKPLVLRKDIGKPPLPGQEWKPHHNEPGNRYVVTIDYSGLPKAHNDEVRINTHFANGLRQSSASAKKIAPYITANMMKAGFKVATIGDPKKNRSVIIIFENMEQTGLDSDNLNDKQPKRDDAKFASALSVAVSKIDWQIAADMRNPENRSRRKPIPGSNDDIGMGF